MMRIVALVSVAALAAACSPEMGAPAAPSTDAAPASEPHADPAPPAPAADAGRVGTMNIKCGTEDFRIVFEDARAVLVNADGSNTDLPKLEPQPGAPANVTTYTNGTMTFTKEGGGDTPTTIKFARGRMAFQDCAIAVN